MRTNVYIDAFNLYYGCLKDTPYKWLDPLAFCRIAIPHNQIHRIRYFTAKIRARLDDPQQPERQQAYLRALQTIPDLSIHLGRYLESKVRMRLADPPPGGPRQAQVLNSEEKGSDVNLATYLLLDAFDRDCEAAVIISNDSDLMEPIRLVRKRFALPVVVLHPCRPPRRASIDLKKVASKSLLIEDRHLAEAQFPPTLTDAIGTVHKPSIW
jgi:uncharacterized LabA/DUF88 family protein